MKAFLCILLFPFCVSAQPTDLTPEQVQQIVQRVADYPLIQQRALAQELLASHEAGRPVPNLQTPAGLAKVAQRLFDRGVPPADIPDILFTLQQRQKAMIRRMGPPASYEP